MLEWGEPKPNPHPTVVWWNYERHGIPLPQTAHQKRVALAKRFAIAFVGLGPWDWRSEPRAPRSAVELIRFHERNFPKRKVGERAWAEYQVEHRLLMAEELITLRIEQLRRFGASITSDDPLDMLVELYVNQRRWRPSSVQALSGALAASSATCARWAAVLVSKNLAVFRKSDVGLDGLQITDHGVSEVSALLDFHIALRVGAAGSEHWSRSPESIQSFREFRSCSWRSDII